MKKYSLAMAILATLSIGTSFGCDRQHSSEAQSSTPGKAQPASIKTHEQLMQLASQTSDDASRVYTTQVTPMGELANIFPTVELQVKKSEGNKRLVTVNGFQMEGAESVIYQAKGQRSIIAVVQEKGQQQVELGKVSEDDYGNKWRSASLTGEINAPVLASQQPIWQYANQLDESYCSSCHAKVEPQRFTVNAWGPVAKSMGARTNISPLDLQILTKYFESNAKDAVNTSQ